MLLRLRTSVRKISAVAFTTSLWSCAALLAQNGAPSDTVPNIAPPSADYRFPNAQTFVYNAEWHMFNAGTATLRMEADGSNEKLTATGTSAGALNMIFPVHSWLNARIDSKAFCSTYIFKHSEEGKRKKEVQIQIDSVRKKSVTDEKNLKTGEAKHEEEDVPACSTDIIGGFFYLGSLPLRAHEIETFPVVDGGTPTVVQAKVETRETVKVPAGEFRTVRLALLPLSGKFQGKGEIWIWYSDDTNRTPVQMKAKLQWGSVMFKLQKIE